MEYQTGRGQPGIYSVLAPRFYRAAFDAARAFPSRSFHTFPNYDCSPGVGQATDKRPTLQRHPTIQCGYE